MTQTAVEWLVKKITNRQNGVFDGFPHLSVDKIYNQAKEMEKQQIINALHYFGIENAEQYYNETFNK